MTMPELFAVLMAVLPQNNPQFNKLDRSQLSGLMQQFPDKNHAR